MSKNFRGYHKFQEKHVPISPESPQQDHLCRPRVNYSTAGKILLAFKRRQGSNEEQHSSP